MRKLLQQSKFNVQVDDWRINAVLAGDGPLLMFIHGIGLSWKWWELQLAHFQPSYSVCAIDLPGSGDSSDLTDPPEPARFSRLIESVIDAIGRGPAVLIGHSLGGYVAIQAALSGSLKIRGLALVAPAGFGPVENVLVRALSIPTVGEQLAKTGSTGLKVLMHSTVRQHSVLTDQLLNSIALDARTQRQFLFQLRIALQYGGTKPSFIFPAPLQLAAPVWLAWGVHDSIFSVATGERAAEMLSVPPPTWYLKSGHMPQLEEPKTFNNALARFVQSVLD